MHPGQAKTFVPCALPLETDTIVLDAQAQLSIVGDELHSCEARTAVLYDVVQGFLRDAVDDPPAAPSSAGECCGALGYCLWLCTCCSTESRLNDAGF